MKTTMIRTTLLVILGLLLGGCFTQNTPEDVTKAFWEAVLDGDAESAVKYSTLTDVKAYDAFEKDWTGFEPTWGKIVIEGEKASVDARFINPNSDDTDGRRVTTYLVMKEGNWKVDYAHTRKEIQGGVFGELFGKINEIGNDLAREFDSSKDEIKSEMDRMSKELESFSEEISREASDSLEQMAKELQKSLEELSDEAKRALEKDDELSEEEKRRLNSVVDDLDNSHDKLDDPSVESISEGSRSMTRAQREMIIIDEKEMQKYQEKWQQMEKQMESDIQRFLDEFSSGDEPPEQTRI